MKHLHKGFSLIEIIIVIAIMAILIGISVPVLFRFLNRSYVSSDIQLCDSVQSALNIAMNDPDVVNSEDDSKSQINSIKSGNVLELNTLSDSIFKDTMNEILGYDVTSISGNREHFRSKQAKINGVLKVQYYDSSFYIWIDGSDASGKDDVAYTVADASSIVDNSVIYVR